MTAKQLFQSLALILLGSTLLGCGGGGGGGLVSGIGGTGITASGTITGFGSIFVNGVEFETGTASVTLDGNPGSEAGLRLGMVVRVSGTVDDTGTRGTASEVEFDDDVQGPLSGPIEPDPDGLSSTFTVLGVPVRADSTKTVFDGVGFDTLAVNDWVEVSGFFDGAGELQATRIEKKGDFTTFRIVANSFLPHQVRSTVGLLIRLGLGKIGIGDFCDIMEARRVGSAGPLAPACGLCLTRVSYAKPLGS